MSLRSLLLLCPALCLTSACGGEAGGSLPATYAFGSRFAGADSSVAYSGQTMRHLLIGELRRSLDGLTEQIDRGDVQPAEEGDVVARLDFYFRFDGDAAAGLAPLLATDPPLLQETYGEVSTGASLDQKLAGNDPATDYVDWSTDFRGWSDPALAQHGGSITSPTGLVTAMFETVEANALKRAQGDPRTGPDGSSLPVTVTESGLDLAQLTEKFFLVALAFHQAADDYLDDDVEGKGLLADHVDDAGGYTALEHAWDEAFGYFGAARDYGDYDLADVAGADRYRDSIASDGRIDLKSEYNFGASRNAARRDLDSAAGAETDFAETAWDAFRRGRDLIADRSGPIDPDDLEALRAQRDRALGAWEAAYAATVVHYINEQLQDLAAIGTDDYGFLDHAKHWSEAKGFALGFQFNPRSPVSAGSFDRLHTLLGDAPVLPVDGAEAVDAHRLDLLEARAILADAFSFDAANLGDDQGLGGW